MGIQGRTSLMLMTTDPSKPQYEHLKGIEEYVHSASELTRQLLGFARCGKYAVRSTNVNELVSNQSRMFGRTKKQISIHGHYEENIWPVEVDRGQIEQVLLNIFVNAWQAMPGGGDLFITTENITIKKRNIKPYPMRSGEYVKISIADTGVGMDMETQKRIFDPFFTTKEMGRGTGLGLASVYGIVKNHDGFIDVKSKKGEGSKFNIYLPVTTKNIQKDPDLQEEALKGRETLLVVDDEEMILEVNRKILKQLGYGVLVARNGQEAIDILNHSKKKRKDSKEKAEGSNAPDMVILDMVMPDMDGDETYSKIKEINPYIKVLLSSGYSIDGHATDLLRRGCNGFIQKPFDVVTLSRKIREILDK
jgi:CheY-like chemotaxis protein